MIKGKCKGCYAKRYYRRNSKQLKARKQILDLFCEDPHKEFSAAEIKKIPDCSTSLVYQTLNKLKDSGQIVSPRHGKYKLATTGPENCVFYPGYREPIYGEEIIGCIEEGQRKLCIRCSGPKVGRSE